MTTAFSLVFIFAFLGFFSTIQAYPTGLYARQDIPAPPACVVACAREIVPIVPSCTQIFGLCIQRQCMNSEFNAGSNFVGPYCAGNGIVHADNGVLVTDLPSVPSGAVPTTTPVPLTAGPSTVIVTEFVTLSNIPSTTIGTYTLTTSIPVPAPTSIMISTDTPTPTLVSATVSLSDPNAPSAVIESMNSSTALRSPAAISVYVIISIIIILLILVLVRRWNRKHQRDYIIPTHRRTRGKSFLIDESSLKRHSFQNAFELTAKPAPIYNLSLKEGQPLPAVPIPTKDSSTPSVALALSYVPQMVITRAPPRNYTALPGRSPSPGHSPESEKSFVSQTFAAGRERAITNIRHSREGSRSPTSPISPASSTSSVGSDMYMATTRAPLPAHAYMTPHQPTAPSPLRAQLPSKPKPIRVSTIAEEPRTPHGAQSVFSMETTVSQPFSVLSSKVETAQRVRPTFASHVRGPHSSDRIRQFTFPNANPRQSLNETELQITISDALMDDTPVSRSQTPNGSIHRGAGGSVSSISKVQGKFQALVGGLRRDRD
ncbi:hypothetical protein RSOLAG1IB_06706 [Rhizoctonia solani AG-1 IB]|uniref:Transmembrane protein n=1 Tax=Thanatephorus cucumeris (strain AG1-IB / isolate 7/3/14) TaxID=1108050 RepID=A0A0B7FAH6_THACB|nr:hypothetical protein RSOLAG1IB_06706 [Rhizoctonia solani AG-1 IB]